MRCGWWGSRGLLEEPPARCSAGHPATKRSKESDQGSNHLRCPVARERKGHPFFGLVELKGEPFPKKGKRAPLGNWESSRVPHFATSPDTGKPTNSRGTSCRTRCHLPGCRDSDTWSIDPEGTSQEVETSTRNSSQKQRWAAKLVQSLNGQYLAVAKNG